MEDVLCALCGIDDARPYQDENGYRAVRCNRCGLVYVQPRPSAAEMKALYEQAETGVDLGSHLRKRDYRCVQARKCLELVRRFRPSRIAFPQGQIRAQARTGTAVLLANVVAITVYTLILLVSMTLVRLKWGTSFDGFFDFLLGRGQG